MRERVKRLLHGQTCKGCGKKRRVRWYSDTGCCSFDCLHQALTLIDAGFFPLNNRLAERWEKGWDA